MGARVFEFAAGEDLPEDAVLAAASYVVERRVVRFVIESGQWPDSTDDPAVSGDEAAHWQLRRAEAAKQGQNLGGGEVAAAERAGAFTENEVPGTDVQVQPRKPSGDAAMPTGLSRATSGPGQDGPEVRFASAPQTPVEEARQVEAQDQQQRDAHGVVRGSSPDGGEAPPTTTATASSASPEQEAQPTPTMLPEPPSKPEPDEEEEQDEDEEDDQNPNPNPPRPGGQQQQRRRRRGAS